MSTAQEPRQPRAFDAADPASLRSRSRRRSRKPPQPTPRHRGRRTAHHPPDARRSGPPRLRWGSLLVSALAGAAALGARAWFARLVSAALLREDWMGWFTLALLLVAGCRRADAAAARVDRLLAPEPAEPHSAPSIQAP